MTEVLHSLSQNNIASSQSSYHDSQQNHPLHPNRASFKLGPLASSSSSAPALSSPLPSAAAATVEENKTKKGDTGEGGEESVFEVLVAALRKSLLVCRAAATAVGSMEIGWPTDVQHVAHVTFDRFDGFLGLPVEFEPEVPRRPPSASTTVFGVSTQSMQCSYDSRGNSVPTILLQMQRRLYSLGGLQAEGIFRINPDNSQEECVRRQLNRGIVPDGTDVHCLAGLIKAWFRELPTGVLDSFSPEQVMQCGSEQDCVQLVTLLPSTEAAILDWAINLMADVVEEAQYNKMNAHNIATVFAPNMTQITDPYHALMHVVHLMNFLKTLIIKTLRERENSDVESVSISPPEYSDDNSPPLISAKEATNESFVVNSLTLVRCQTQLIEEKSTSEHFNEIKCQSIHIKEAKAEISIAKSPPSLDSQTKLTEEIHTPSQHSDENESHRIILHSKEANAESSGTNSPNSVSSEAQLTEAKSTRARAMLISQKSKIDHQYRIPSFHRGQRKVSNEQTSAQATGVAIVNSNRSSVASRINSRVKQIEAGG